MPSSHRPIDAFENPERFGGMDCRIRVPQTLVQELRERLTAEVGSREEHLDFLQPEARERLQALYVRLGSPELTFSNGWEVFTTMVQAATN